jgi:hypothetical protein
MTCLSKHHSARSAVKNLFTQPQYNSARSAEKILFTQHKLSFDIPIIFEISQSEISKMMGMSKQFSAAEGGE